MKRLIVLLLGALALCLPAAPSYAQQIQFKIVSACGTLTATPPVDAFYWGTMTPTGLICTSGSGGGGSASFTAAATPFAVSAGTSKPAGISTINSALWTIPVKPGTTTEVDLSNQCVWGADGATCASTANPFPTLEPSTAATGSAVPAKATYVETSQSGVGKGIIGCDNHALYDASDNGSKTIVAGVSAKKIYVCGYVLATGGTATNLSLSSGTGSDCVTTSVNITPAYQLVANDRVGGNAAFWNGLITLTNADNLCVKASAGNAHQAEVWYTVQ